jgi:PilZ domain
MPVPEKRKNPRIKKPCYAQVNIYLNGKPADWEIVTLRDLSSGGMSFSYHKPLQVGTLIKAKIKFPPAEGPVEVTGKVVRLGREGVLLSTGIEFTEIDPKQQELIGRFAAKWFPNG